MEKYNLLAHFEKVKQAALDGDEVLAAKLSAESTEKMNKYLLEVPKGEERDKRAHEVFDQLQKSIKEGTALLRSKTS